MTRGSFDPVARALQVAMTDWFARHRDGEVPAGRTTIATNSTLLDRRGRPLLELLARRGMPSLEGRRVIDLGCGFGGLAVYLAWHGATVTGIDPNRRPAEVGRAVAGEFGLPVVLGRGRMEQVREQDGTFDVAVMNNTLCYVVEPAARRAALREALRIVRPGGVLLVRDPNRHHPLDHFSGVPLVPLLGPDAAERVVRRLGVSRPRLRLASSRGMARALAQAGWSDVRHELVHAGVLHAAARPVARYLHVTAVRR